MITIIKDIHVKKKESNRFQINSNLAQAPSCAFCHAYCQFSRTCTITKYYTDRATVKITGISDGFQVGLWDGILLLVTELYTAHVESLWWDPLRPVPTTTITPVSLFLYGGVFTGRGGGVGSHSGTTWKTDWVCHHMFLRKMRDG